MVQGCKVSPKFASEVARNEEGWLYPYSASETVLEEQEEAGKRVRTDIRSAICHIHFFS